MEDLQKSIRLLIVEDNPVDFLLIEKALHREKFAAVTVSQASSLASAQKQLCEGEFDATLLDLFLPDSQGLDTFFSITQVCKTIPILILSGEDDESLALKALENGAKDYLMKGDGINRIGRALKYVFAREKQIDLSAEHKLEFRHLTLDLFEQTVSIKIKGETKTIDLTQSEFRVLLYLVRHADRAVSRDEIYKNLHGGENMSKSSRLVDAHISSLRKKLAPLQYIKSAHNVGYRFKTD